MKVKAKGKAQRVIKFVDEGGGKKRKTYTDTTTVKKISYKIQTNGETIDKFKIKGEACHQPQRTPAVVQGPWTLNRKPKP